MITKFNYFINEALKDDIPSYMSDIIKNRHGKKYLNYDVPKHTDAIPNCKIEVKDYDGIDKIIKNLLQYFDENISKQFDETLACLFINKYFDEIQTSLNYKFENLNFDIEDLKKIYSNQYRLLQAKDNDINNPIFSNNKSNLYNFIKSYNKAFPTKIVDYDVTKDKVFRDCFN